MNKVKKENKELNALEWIREIRDKNYNKYKGKSAKEYIELINNKAKKLYSKKKISR
ncbi:MAG: hypothetical protein M3R36_05875 [Bacteroidota bacterium]|nr:hypothetical protein [Bacteroidota bacterium]